MKASLRVPVGMGMREIALVECGLRSRPMWVGTEDSPGSFLGGGGASRTGDVVEKYLRVGWDAGCLVVFLRWRCW